jgi:hypothetical protein
VDKTRTNEFGFTPEDVDAPSAPPVEGSEQAQGLLTAAAAATPAGAAGSTPSSATAPAAAASSAAAEEVLLGGGGGQGRRKVAGMEVNPQVCQLSLKSSVA